MASFYDLFRADDPATTATCVHVCDDIGCRLFGTARPTLLAAAGSTAARRTPARAWACASGRRRARAGGGARPDHTAGRGRPAPRAPAVIRRCRCCPGRRGRPDQPGGLPGPGGYRGPGAGLRAGPEGVIERGHRVGAEGARRGRLPHRRQVAGRRPTPPGRPRGGQRRRVRAGHVQGPDGDGGRPVRAGRGAHHRRVRQRAPPRAGSTSGASTRWRPAARRRAGPGPRAPGSSGSGSPGRAQRSTSSCGGGRGLHLRRGDGAVQLDRGLPGRAAQQAAVPGDPRPVRPRRR